MAPLSFHSEILVPSNLPSSDFWFVLCLYSPHRIKGSEKVKQEQPGLPLVWLFSSVSPWAHPNFMLITLEKLVSSGKKTLKLQSISPVFRPMIFIFWSLHLLLYRFKPPPLHPLPRLYLPPTIPNTCLRFNTQHSVLAASYLRFWVTRSQEIKLKMRWYQIHPQD